MTDTNLGPSATRGDVVVVDDLPSGLSFVSASSDTATASCTESAGTVTCTNTASMALGETWTITLLVDLSSSSGGSQIQKVASASGGNEVNGVPLATDVLVGIYADLADPGNPLGAALGITAVPSASGSTVTAVAAPPALAWTGASSLALWRLGLLLLTAGMFLGLLSRRRRTITDQG